VLAPARTCAGASRSSGSNAFNPVADASPSSDPTPLMRVMRDFPVRPRSLAGHPQQNNLPPDWNRFQVENRPQDSPCPPSPAARLWMVQFARQGPGQAAVGHVHDAWVTALGGERVSERPNPASPMLDKLVRQSRSVGREVLCFELE